MPESPSIIIKWDDFMGGDYGALGPEKGPKNSFSGSNMVVRANGALGPRAGLKNITPDEMPDGPLLGLASGPVPERDGMFIIAENVYRFDLNTTATAPTLIDAFDEAPDQPVVPKLDTNTWLVPVNYSPDATSDGVYRVDPINDTVTKLTGSSGGHDVVLIDQQVIVARSGFSPMILGSSPTDPNNWSEGRFFDVGDNWQVTALFRLRNVLAIMKRTGMHVMLGILGDIDTERVSLVSTTDGPLHPWHAARDQTDKIWFWPLFRKGPASWDGNTYPEYLGRYEMATRENDNTTADTPLARGVVTVDGYPDDTTIVFVQGGESQKGLIRSNGVWTFHDWETNISGMCCANGAQLVTTDGGAPDEPSQIYTTLFNLNRPAFVGEELVSPGDGSDVPIDAHATMVQWWAEEGREVKPSQVTVDFTSFDTGTEETNHFDITLRILARDRAWEAVRSTDPDITEAPEGAAEPEPFDEEVGTSTTTGVRRRRSFMFNCPPGAGLELTVSNVRGCDIHAFHVMAAKRDVRNI